MGKSLIFLPEADSTNNYAVSMLKNVNLLEGTVVHAASQTSGKGSRGKGWISEPGCNLTASYVLRPSFLEPKDNFFLYKVSALACAATLTQLVGSSQHDIRIKWPNDILVNGKKISGILIENNIFNDKIKWSVVGIGINLNQVDFGNLPNTASVMSLAGQPVEVSETLKVLSAFIEKYYMMLRNAKQEEIRNEYNSLLFARDQFRPFMVNGTFTTCRVTCVRADGLLTLETDEGKMISGSTENLKWIM
jgi:BirA family biotin operon repressor/biotin-[acetyl-CoA-carboxylase] ligase